MFELIFSSPGVFVAILTVGGTGVYLFFDRFLTHRQQMRTQEAKHLLKCVKHLQEVASLQGAILAYNGEDNETVRQLKERLETLETIATDVDFELNRRLLQLKEPGKETKA